MQFLLFDLGQTSRIGPLLILAVGALSSLLGVLYALMEHDLKRLLAYHSIENIGIILLGMGVMAVGIDWHLPGASRPRPRRFAVSYAKPRYFQESIVFGRRRRGTTQRHAQRRPLGWPSS